MMGWDGMGWDGMGWDGMGGCAGGWGRVKETKTCFSGLRTASSTGVALLDAWLVFPVLRSLIGADFDDIGGVSRSARATLRGAELSDDESRMAAATALASEEPFSAEPPPDDMVEAPFARLGTASVRGPGVDSSP